MQVRYWPIFSIRHISKSAVLLGAQVFFKSDWHHFARQWLHRDCPSLQCNATQPDTRARKMQPVECINVIQAGDNDVCTDDCIVKKCPRWTLTWIDQLQFRHRHSMERRKSNGSPLWTLVLKQTPPMSNRCSARLKHTGNVYSSVTLYFSSLLTVELNRDTVT